MESRRSTALSLTYGGILVRVGVAFSYFAGCFSNRSPFHISFILVGDGGGIFTFSVVEEAF